MRFMLITSGGVMVRTPASEVSCLSRYAQGVRLINLDAGSSACMCGAD